MKFFPGFNKSKSIAGIRFNYIYEIFDLFKKENLKYLHIKEGNFYITINKPEINLSKKTPVNLKNESLIIDENNSEKSLSDNIKYDYTIEAPISGTFYRAPSPDSQPYVKVGDFVNQESVLCIIESMKIMNEIKSPYEGIIVKILKSNGEKIKKGEPIFYLKKPE